MEITHEYQFEGFTGERPVKLVSLTLLIRAVEKGIISQSGVEYLRGLNVR